MLWVYRNHSDGYTMDGLKHWRLVRRLMFEHSAALGKIYVPYSTII